MKAQVIITALLLSFVTLSQAASPQRFLKVYDIRGHALLMPLQEEEAADSLPFDLHKTFLEACRADANRIIDLSGMITPEEEVNDIPCHLKALFPQLTAK